MFKCVKVIKNSISINNSVKKSIEQDKINFDKEWEKWGNKKTNNAKKIP